MGRTCKQPTPQGPLATTTCTGLHRLRQRLRHLLLLWAAAAALATAPAPAAAQGGQPPSQAATDATCQVVVSFASTAAVLRLACWGPDVDAGLLSVQAGSFWGSSADGVVQDLSGGEAAVAVR